jgi:hypothetical protein
MKPHGSPEDKKQNMGKLGGSLGDTQIMLGASCGGQILSYLRSL